MPFFCCIRKQPEDCDNDIPIVEINGEIKNIKTKPEDFLVQNETVDNGNTKYEKDESFSNKNQNQEANPLNNNKNNNNTSALQTYGSTQEVENADNKVTEQIENNIDDEITVEEVITEIMSEANKEELKIYEEYVSKLEKLADIIEQRLDGNLSVANLIKNDAQTNQSRESTLEFSEASNTWHANNISNGGTINIETKHDLSVNLSNCKNTTFKITGETNKLEIVECISCNIITENVKDVLISDSKKIQLQPLENMSTVHATTVDGLMVFLNECNANSTQFFTKKCSEINFSSPSEEGQVLELPVPEQIKSTWNGQQWISEAYVHN